MKLEDRFTYIATFIMIIGLLGLMAESQYEGAIGYYKYGYVGIKAWKLHDYTEYKLVADHEWGHHIYRQLSYKEKMQWYRIVDDCSIESDYAASFYSRSVRMEEEFAESHKKYRSGLTICEAKEEFLMATFRNHFI